MRTSKTEPKFPNLTNEMRKRGVEVNDLVAVTGKSKSSIYDYMRGVGGGGFMLTDAVAIQETFFPDLDIKYLFSDSQEKIETPA
jgi:hypothetical protein